MEKLCVCTFGSYKDIGESQRQEVVKLGEMLACAGYTVISGGFGGTMEDISRGVKAAGGKTIGITYYRNKNAPVRKANVYIDEEIVACGIFERIRLMMEKSDAFVIFSGGTGTLLELASVLEYMNKGFMDFKPVIMMGRYWKPVVDILNAEPLLNDSFAREKGLSSCADLVVFAQDAQGVMDVLKKRRL